MELYYKGMLVGILIGVLSVEIIIPILQQLESVIVTALEIINGYSTLNVSKHNVEIAKLRKEMEDVSEPISTNVIGFELPNVEEEEEE
jgi:hypothetical protein